MPKKKTVVRRKGVGISHTYRGPSRQKRPGAFTRLLQRLPRWAWWMGGAGIAGVYIWFFYYFFVSPYGFRWRALYGDISYPEGYEIHGIDISHYQGTIDWNTLKNEALIKECPIRFIMIKATEGATQIDENFEDNFYQARDICDYRRLHGPIKSLHQLSLLKTFPPAQIERLEPYVSYE